MSKRITFSEDTNQTTSTKKHLKSNLKVIARDKYKEFDEIELYFSISEIDKRQNEIYKNPEKWYLEKRKDALKIVQNFSQKFEFSKHTLYAAIHFSDLTLGFNNSLNLFISLKSKKVILIPCCFIIISLKLL